MGSIHLATLDDLPFLLEIESTCFPPSRQFTPRAIRHSIESTHQDVFILTHNGQKCASAIVHRFEKTWRLYSIAVLPPFRHLSLGRELLNFIIGEAKKNHIHQMTLEVDANQEKLIKWYQSFEFIFVKELPDFYGPGEPGHKMVLRLRQETHRLHNIIVTDQPIDWLKTIDGIEVVEADQFINSDIYSTGEFRVFNLCSSYQYQTIGYYVSLLASARDIRAIPNVATLEDFTDSIIIGSIGDEVEDLIQQSLRIVRTHSFSLLVNWGKTDNPRYSQLAKALYKLFEAPLLEFTFEKKNKWRLVKAQPMSIESVDANPSFVAGAAHYFRQKRFLNPRYKNYRYDLAILVDPKEPAPPSGQTALARFKRAAEKVGFYTEFITKEDYQRITQFDALFIRATTNVNDYTYQFSRYAYAEGLVVIDDPWSILKCSNKLFLHESMKSNGILTPKTFVVSKKTPLQDVINHFTFPIVLKRPDSASSLGVFKVNSAKELQERLTMLFENSELILAQEYITSSFDWRVGVLNNKPLYVCKYFMAKNHWQIYKWEASKNDYQVGAVETYLVEDAPKAVVETALEATDAMGDGFYGVDLKEANGKIYVIEVNDNPSIDHHWEDKILGDELYLQIMRHFVTQIEAARNIKHRIAPSK